MTQEKDWVEVIANGVVLRFFVQPKASRTGEVGLFGDPPRMKIRVAAPPIDGEANAALLAYVKGKLKVRNQDLEILRGHQSRAKDILCRGITLDRVRTAFK